MSTVLAVAISVISLISPVKSLIAKSQGSEKCGPDYKRIALSSYTFRGKAEKE